VSSESRVVTEEWQVADSARDSRGWTIDCRTHSASLPSRPGTIAVHAGIVRIATCCESGWVLCR